MEASSLKFVTYEREESIGHIYYFTFFNFLFVVEYSHEISDIHSESLDDVINDIIGKYDVIYLEDSNIWTSDREITLDAYRP